MTNRSRCRWCVAILGVAGSFLVMTPAVLARPKHGGPGRKPSVARVWNEQLLGAIRIDIPKPPVHARNLFHLSVAMWDAWAAYSPRAVGYLVTEKHRSRDLRAARAEAISFAAYRLLQYRFPVGYFDGDGKPCHPNAPISQASLDAQMEGLGFDRSFTSTDGPSPAALGNRIAAAVIAHGQQDGSNEGAGLCYPDGTGYASVNPELIFALPDAGYLIDPNRWQPLAFDYFVTQNGIALGQAVQSFVGVGWGDVLPFALALADVGPGTGLYLDPGPQPRLGGIGEGVVKNAMLELIRLSSQIDTSANVLVDISPSAMLNNPLGTDEGQGRRRNPVTRRPYPPNLVDRADFQRVVTEYWADGPRSETPPGHWNVIANKVADHPRMRKHKRIGGRGRVVGDLEWDVKVYLALNGAVHDAAIWAWSNKQYYDSSRPITLIRHMARMGQSSDSSAPSYHSDGLPLVPDLIELITSETTRAGGRHAHLAGHEGEIAIRAWLDDPSRPSVIPNGVGFRRGVEWMPYMPRNFVTPPFPGYTSGHSAFSRSAAEVLTAITGSRFFPGGIATLVAPQDEFLSIEPGPARTLKLQWATYYDAADQAGISRRFGGIHPYFDDYPSRIAGSQIGKKAWARARALYGRSSEEHHRRGS